MLLGVDLGEHVAIVSPNTVEFVAAFFGCSMAGAVAVPISHRSTRAELQPALTMTDAVAALVVGHG